jgi:S1-C subfamily serine protease
MKTIALLIVSSLVLANICLANAVPTNPFEQINEDAIYSSYINTKSSVVAIDNDEYNGSGFIVKVTDKKDYIITCDHVLQGDLTKEKIISYHKYFEKPAKIVARDKADDLVLLSCDKIPGVESVKFGEYDQNSTFLVYNDTRNYEFNCGAYFGDNRASIKCKDINGIEMGFGLRDFIFFTFYPGMSGSAVFNEKGEVVGVAEGILVENPEVGIMINEENVKQFLKDEKMP